jgi:hypothetical protein
MGWLGLIRSATRWRTSSMRGPGTSFVPALISLDRLPADLDFYSAIDCTHSRLDALLGAEV